MQIVTLTMNPAIDVTVSVEQMLPDRKLRSSRPTYEPGGGGINVARVIHMLGGQCQAVYAAGGATGRQLDDLLASKGIECRRIGIEGRTREDIAVIEDRSEQMFRVVMPGPELGEDEERQCFETMEGLSETPEYVVISGSLPRGVASDFYRRVVAALKPRGTRLIVDTKPDILEEAVAEGVFLIKPNMRELRQLSGKNLDEEKQQERAAKELIDRGLCEVVVLSLGAAGVLLVSGEITERLRAPSVPIRSKVGAGDSMVGGLTLGLARGMSIHNAVRYGIAAGSAAVMTPGTQLCRADDVRQLFAELQ